MFKRLVAAALVFGAAATAPPAAAQMVCGPHERMTAQLEQVFGERRAGLGLRGPSALYELWVSGKTGSWTFLLVRPDGLACPVASGDYWTDTAPSTVAEDADPA